MYSSIGNVCYIISISKKWIFDKMTLEEIKNICRKGYLGIIPGWKGYLKHNYGTNQLQFVNNDYVLLGKELEDKLKDKTDMYYII